MLQLEKDRGSSAAAREGGKCKKIKQGGGINILSWGNPQRSVYNKVEEHDKYSFY